MDTEIILKKLAKIYEGEESVDTKFVRADEENGIEADTLFTIHQSFGTIGNEAVGRFFFIDAENGSHLFISTISYCEVKTLGAIPYVCVEAASENNTLPFGNLAYDPDNNEITFSSKVILPEDFTEEEIFGECRTGMLMTVSISERYAEKYIKLASFIPDDGQE